MRAAEERDPKRGTGQPKAQVGWKTWKWEAVGRLPVLDITMGASSPLLTPGESR